MDDKRNPLLPTEKVGPTPKNDLSKEDHYKNNLPDCLKRWAKRTGSEQDRPQTEQSFCVSKDEIKAHGYDLSLNRYKEIVYEEVEHRKPLEILAELKEIESDISKGIYELEAMLK